MRRRSLLSACGLAAVGLAGCLSTGSSESPNDSTTDSPTDSATGTAPPSGTPVSTNRQAARNPDPDHEITLENRDDAAHTVALTVTGPDGTAVHESRTDLDPGERTLAYNLRRADPDGVEAYDVVASLGTRREEATVETSGCYGDVIVTVRDEGDFDLVYAVC